MSRSREKAPGNLAHLQRLIAEEGRGGVRGQTATCSVPERAAFSRGLDRIRL